MQCFISWAVRPTESWSSFGSIIKAIKNVFRIFIARYKDRRGWETSSRVCITVSNSPNSWSVYIRLCKHGKKAFYCFYKITSCKNCNAGKDKKNHFTDQNVSSYNINLTMAFLNWPIKLTFWKSGGGMFRTRVSLRHTTMFACTPLGQSELAYYSSYFIKAHIWEVSVCIWG